MTSFELYKFIHVFAAMIWVGGSVLIEFTAARGLKAGQRDDLMKVAKDSETGGRLFAVAGALVLIFGVLMVVDVPLYEFDQLWIVIGILGVAIGAFLGPAYFTPRTNAAIAALDADDTATARSTLESIVWMARLELLILVIVVWAMITRPGF